MPLAQTRTHGHRAALAVALGFFIVGLPASAADSPAQAVDDLARTITSGDLSEIERVVCSAQVDAVREQFDPAIALGLPNGSDVLAAGLAFSLEDIDIEVIDEQADVALVNLTAIMRLEVDAAQERALVRAMAEVDGTPIGDAELDEIAPFVLDLLREPEPIEDAVEVVREGGQWLVCGGIGATERMQGLEDSVSFDGICGLVSLADVNAITPEALAYGASDGGEDYCSYSSTSPETFSSATLTLGRDETIDLYRSIYPDAIELSVAGRTALVSGAELFVELDEGVLLVEVFSGDTPPADFDAGDYLARLAELFIPYIPDLEAGDDGIDGLDDGSQGSLCDAISLIDLNSITGLAFDDAAGDPAYCAYSNAADDADAYVITVSVEPSGLDDFKAFYPGGGDEVVAGLPAYALDDQLWVEMEQGFTTLSISLFLEGTSADRLDAIDVARRIAALAVPAYLADAGQDS